MIPQTIHQTWRTTEIPTQWQSYRLSWLTYHPGWTSTLWTDVECRALVEDTQPHLLDLYDAFPLAIQRADMFRYVLLAARGGVYADLDFESRRPLTELLQGAEVVLGTEPPSHADDPAVRSRGLSRIVCNALMASAPGHPFWDHVLDLVGQADPNGPVLDTTGVFMLTRAVDTYSDPEQLRIVGADALYPLTKWEAWGEHALTADTSARIDAAYAVHHWSSSWQQDRLRALALDLARKRAMTRQVRE